ncbi:phenylacetate-CoA ligase [Desulfomicrobium macestii]|uniref:Phenylacetate-CoA ligase n=1 Tax=Desulfomicrobium macestii TaxID=90731 RepID=A0ABR9H093_9BACT|nr:AMP-binding protein [Desulfomicrobium macestii]MBE1424120.1 phenylacetate-CoA ligase [Desulfomicrobium macestii]
MDRTKGYYHDLETESRSVRAGKQRNSIQAMVKKALSFDGEFRERLASAGVVADEIRSLDDFTSIPVLRKKDLSRLQREKGLTWFLPGAPGTLARIYQSPGPIYDPEGRGPDYWGWTEAFHAAGFRSGDLAQMTFSYHLTPAGLMLEEPLRALGCAVIPAGPGNSSVQLQLMQELPVTAFVGMTSFLKTLGEKARDKGLDPKKDFGLRVAFVAAERLPESLRTEVQDMFGMIIRQGYGTADVGCIAYECPELGGMHLSNRCFVEICDPATGRPVSTGEIGEVVVTPFTPDYPLIRLATGDLSRLDDADCPCGRTAPKLQGILGRVDDTAKVRGQFVYTAQVAQALSRFPQVLRHQVVVSNDEGKETLTLRIETNGPADHGAIAAGFQEVIKLRPVVVTLGLGETIPEGAPALVDERTYD